MERFNVSYNKNNNKTQPEIATDNIRQLQCKAEVFGREEYNTNPLKGLSARMRVIQNKTELTRKSVKHLSHAVLSRSNMIAPLDPNVIKRAKEKGERVRESGRDKDRQRQRQTDGDGERPETQKERERETEKKTKTETQRERD